MKFAIIIPLATNIFQKKKKSDIKIKPKIGKGKKLKCYSLETWMCFQSWLIRKFLSKCIIHLFYSLFIFTKTMQLKICKHNSENGNILDD